MFHFLKSSWRSLLEAIFLAWNLPNIPFGGRAPLGPAGGAKALPQIPSRNKGGLLLRGGEGREGGREGKGEGEGGTCSKVLGGDRRPWLMPMLLLIVLLLLLLMLFFLLVYCHCQWCCGFIVVRWLSLLVCGSYFYFQVIWQQLFPFLFLSVLISET